MRLAADSASYIGFITLKPDNCLMNFEIKATRYGQTNWQTPIMWISTGHSVPPTGKGFAKTAWQRTYKIKRRWQWIICRQPKDDSKTFWDIDWVAFKRISSFFCIHCWTGFRQRFPWEIKMEQPERIYQRLFCWNEYFFVHRVKPTEMYFFLVETTSKRLKALDKDVTKNGNWTDGILGLAVIRWINQFITINVFDWLSGWGLNMGIVLISDHHGKSCGLSGYVETYVICQDACTETEIDEINKEISETGDAMKKQQEVMGLCGTG